MGFKKNEDVNPTKANHKGMNPEHLALATQELSTLLSEGLIEPTTSLISWYQSHVIFFPFQKSGVKKRNS